MSYVNSPAVIRELDDFISINGCIAGDLFGQVSSESAGLRQISGTGGQVDFITGALEAEHGRAFLAMHATLTDKTGAMHSNSLPHGIRHREPSGKDHLAARRGADQYRSSGLPR